MKQKTLNDVEEGELFFAFVTTVDGPDFRSFFKGKLVELANYYYHCECTTGDPWQAHKFAVNHQVWA